MITERDLRDRFRRFDTRLSDDPLPVPPELCKASVLVPLFLRDGEWRVLLTQRAAHLRSHSGAVAFPGGKQDEVDTDEIAAALREAEEEIGLKPEDVRIVAVFPPSYVAHNNSVTAVLGLIPSDLVPNINIDEVKKVFDLPLSRFLESNFTVHKMQFRGKTIRIYYFADEHDGDTVVTWGYTALYCMLVAMVAFQTDTCIEVVEGVPITKDDAFGDMSSNVVFDERNTSKL